ncbi:MAG: hypothetical protein HQL78_10920 [Magnetococcales bacterium]|nr:hypothetical protein [Magnetococcales bacterium]MBF0420662.1 hypothetical protein [Magnetococcales bacterium]
MAIESYKNSDVHTPGTTGSVKTCPRCELFREYSQDRLKAELLMQQVNTRHIDMNSKLACELERLLERISGQDRKKAMA